MQPLHGHVSPETAYVVDDYPYGRLRCTIKFWLETDVNKGARFCSQTINPKNGRVNAPKKSTYAKLAGCMYLDEQGHCQWKALTEYSNPEEILKFLQDFGSRGKDDTLGQFVKAKTELWRKRVSGQVELGWKINGVVQTKSPEEKQAEHDSLVKELVVLEESYKLIFG